MTFVYTYRSSDGQRHTAEIEADSRDAAFAKVRAELGIKPIKVVAAVSQGQGNWASQDPQDTQDTQDTQDRLRVHVLVVLVVLGVLALVLAFGAWWWLTGRAARPEVVPDRRMTPQDETGDGYRQETRDAFLKLVERAGALEDRCRAELKLLKLDNIHDYAWIARGNDLTPLYRELEKAQSIIDYTRLPAKDLFRDVYSKFPAASANERTDAQRRYGKLMNAIDAEEEHMQSEHLVLLLLDDHRSAWHVERDTIVFTDEKVKQDFLFYSKPTDGSTARWKRDFGSSVETPVVELPQSSNDR